MEDKLQRLDEFSEYRGARRTHLLQFGLVIGGVAVGVGGWLAEKRIRAQLSQQRIVFPNHSDKEWESEEVRRVVGWRAGSQVHTGYDAAAYAEYIALHLTPVADGKTYADVSHELSADPSNADLLRQSNILFKGETLSALLMSVFGFWLIAAAARWAGSVVALASGASMILSVVRKSPSGVSNQVRVNK